MKTLVYFHGYGSSANTEKVHALREMFPNYKVLAFDASVDPEIAKKEVGDQILLSIVDDFSDDELIFIGTSLGAWLANELSNQFRCKAILINPSYDPRLTLGRYGVSEDILRIYYPMQLADLNQKNFYIDPNDEVIDHSVLMSKVDYVEITGGHRCPIEMFKEIVKSL